MSDPARGTPISGTRWLSEQEQQVWREFVAATGMLTAHLETQLQRDSNMAYTYYEVLVRLSEAPDTTMRMSDLAAACHASRSRLSHAIARMEGNGWVSRISCPTDKRGAFATLTEQGTRALREAAPGHVETVRSYLFDVLTEDQVAALGEISAAIVGGLAGRCAEVRENEDCGSEETGSEDTGNEDSGNEDTAG